MLNLKVIFKRIVGPDCGVQQSKYISPWCPNNRTTYIKEGVRTINGYMYQHFFTSTLQVRGRVESDSSVGGIFNSKSNHT